MERRILIVEDDPILNKTLSEFLERRGYKTFSVLNGEGITPLILQNLVDLVLLDIKLPHCNGFELAKFIRQNSEIPIIFITSLNSEADLVKGFQLGADDYIRKPFSLIELEMRIKAIFRRLYRGEVVELGNWVLYYPLEGKVLKRGKPVRLKWKELQLLDLLVRKRGQLVTKEEIYETLYGEREPNENSIRTFISRLRELVGRDRIEVVKERGYRLKS
ncbi:MAG: response regulator transcription factor [Campylobacterales bacterium]